MPDRKSKGGPEDAILLENLQIPAALGVTAGERALRRPVRIDLEIARSLATSGRSDRLDDTLDYGEVYRVVEAVAGQGEHHLVEALGERIAAALLSEFEMDWLEITVRKAKPLAGALDSAGIRLTRYRDT
ncbi:MAG: dihydroneopterin aldolase [Myxococcota bacterium]|nr:dihydroneopterin aldolase [Myxococcota bacterium]